MARFALEYAKGWRPLFESVVEDVTGVDCRTLYDDWIAYITERYDDQYADVKAIGEVAGQNFALHGPSGNTRHRLSEILGWGTKKVSLAKTHVTGSVVSPNVNVNRLRNEQVYINTTLEHLMMVTGLALSIVVRFKKMNRQENRTLTGAKEYGR